MYNIAKSTIKGEKVMTQAQERLKSELENIHDEQTMKQVECFILGILAQQAIEQRKNASNDIFQ